MNITSQRLFNQHIVNPTLGDPAELVKWMGAIQAQDYLGSLWAIGLRLKNNTERDIEKAIAEKKIIRSWPMRGTLHFVASEDLRWMLKWLTPRVFQRSAGLFKEAGLNNKVIIKCIKLFTAALRDGKALTRNEMYAVLENSRISTANQRGLHIIGHLAQMGILCFGPRKGKQHSFVLLDEWLPSNSIPGREESLAMLCSTYFSSHGPATIQDFAWWSGLTITESKNSIESIKSKLASEKINEKIYWACPKLTGRSSRQIFLLPSYDEYLVAYRDRTAAFDGVNIDKIKNSGNGIFSSPIIINGRLGGIWKRSITKEELLVDISLFEPLTVEIEKSIVSEVRHLGKFLNLRLKLSIGYGKTQKKIDVL